MLVVYAHVLVQKDYFDMLCFVHSYGCTCLKKVAHNNAIVVMIGWHIVLFTTIFFATCPSKLLGFANTCHLQLNIFVYD